MWMPVRSLLTGMNMNRLFHTGNSTLLLSGLVTLGTDDSNQVCIAHVILGTKVIHINSHHHQASVFNDCGVIGHREIQSKEDIKLQISQRVWITMRCSRSISCRKMS